MNENKNNINVGDDPTLPISSDINQNILESEYNKLSNEEKILAACKLLGMDHKPVTIRRFICDDYFMGDDNLFNHGKALFDPWYAELEKIYPNSITTKYPWISLGGAVNRKSSGLYKNC